MEINIYLLIGTIVFIIDILRAILMENKDKSVYIVFRGMFSIFLWPIFVAIRMVPLIIMVIYLIFIRIVFPTNQGFCNYLKENQ